MPTATAPRRRIQQKANSTQAQPTVPTPSAVYMEAAMPLVPGNIYGRMGKGTVSGRMQVNARATATAYGNSVVTSDARGANAAQPEKGSGNTALADTGPFNESPWGGVSGRQVRQINTPNSLDSAGEYARTDAFQHGHLIAHDRHIIANQGRTTSSNRQQATGGSPNPEASGPARPAWKMFNRTLSHQDGVDSTRNLDNGQYHAAIIVTGTDRKFPLGQQGTEWVRRNGGTPGLANFRPYGYRGGFNNQAPTPEIRAESGGPYRVRTLLQQGSPLDGPQKVYGGLPWGLHSPTLPGRKQTQTNQRSKMRQVKPVWNVRPLNSKTAGQSWSQSMVSLSGQQAVHLASTPPIRQPGLNSRWLGS